MNRASFGVLQRLLKVYTKSKQEKLLHFLPKEFQEEIEKLPSIEHELILPEISQKQLISFVHYSWFLPSLKSSPPSDQELFFLALDVEKKRKLKPWLQLPFSGKRLLTLAQKFLRNLLVFSMLGEEKDLLPSTFLVSSPLNILLQLSKKQLVQLIDILGIYDLESELSKILDPKLIQKIENSLTHSQLLFMKKNPHLKDSFPSKILDLKDFLEKKEIRHKIHVAGLYRLGRALSLEHPHLIWYIVHLLDMGRGLALKKICDQKESIEATKFISKQILFVIQTTL